MNCKPGQMATIVRAACIHKCVAERIGCPVKVKRLVEPTGLMSAVMILTEGPIWEIETPLSCPNPQPCEYGIFMVPDECLKPFEPESMPEPEAPAVDLPVTAL